MLSWRDWQQGMRPIYRGIKVSMQYRAEPDTSFKNYESFLREIYAVSHTQQFYHALPHVRRGDVQPGDFLVLKGTKSHAVMVVDLAVGVSGDTVALVGHGDTPACEFHLLNYRKNEPWIPLRKGEKVLPLPIRRRMSWDGLRRFK